MEEDYLRTSSLETNLILAPREALKHRLYCRVGLTLRQEGQLLCPFISLAVYFGRKGSVIFMTEVEVGGDEGEIFPFEASPIV